MSLFKKIPVTLSVGALSYLLQLLEASDHPKSLNTLSEIKGQLPRPLGNKE